LDGKKLFKTSKKLDKAYNIYDYVAFEFWVICSPNTKVMAKKLISIQKVRQNRIGVSCNHPVEIAKVYTYNINKSNLKFQDQNNENN